MNPHADSVQQPSDAEIAHIASHMGTRMKDDFMKIHSTRMIFFARTILERFGTRPAAEPCKGTNCKAIDGIGHSKECRAEHEAVIAAAANAERPLFDPNFPNQGYVSDAEWAARIARRKVAEPIQSGSAGEAGQPFYDLAWQYGATQHTSFAGDELEGLTFTPNDFEAFCAALSRQAPAAPRQALLGWTRYEKARKLNVAQWAELHQRNLKGENFDDMIDALPATTQPVQQDTRYGTEQYLRGFNDAKAQFATPPAEKQAAPSGEDFPYDRTFRAIQAATKLENGGTAIGVSVKAFQAEWDRLASQQSERPAPARFSCHLERDFGKAPCDHDCGKLRCMYPSKPAPAGQAVGDMTDTRLMRIASEQSVSFEVAMRPIVMTWGTEIRGFLNAALAASQAERPAVKEDKA